MQSVKFGERQSLLVVKNPLDFLALMSAPSAIKYFEESKAGRSPTSTSRLLLFMLTISGDPTVTRDCMQNGDNVPKR